MVTKKTCAVGGRAGRGGGGRPARLAARFGRVAGTRSVGADSRGDVRAVRLSRARGVGRSGRAPRRHRASARDDDDLPVRRTGRAWRSRRLALVPFAERPVEVPVLAEPGQPPGRLRAARLRRQGLADHRRARQLGDAGLRHPDLHQHRSTRSPSTAPTRASPRDDNPVGSYRTTFTVPADWAGRRVFLHFAGVDSAFYLWVNGKRVGYSEDSRTPAEFDVTGVRQAGPEHAGRRGLPLERRLVPRRPGHVPAERHLPRRLPLEPGARARPRLREPRHARRGSTATARSTRAVTVRNLGAARAGAGVTLELFDAAGKPVGAPVTKKVDVPAGQRGGGEVPRCPCARR